MEWHIFCKKNLEKKIISNMALLLSLLQVTSDGGQSHASPNLDSSATGFTCHFYFFVVTGEEAPASSVF